jgi:hypothetical protein
MTQFLFFFLLTTFFPAAAPEDTEVKAPGIVFFETTIDLGKIPNTAPRDVELSFINQGNAPLKIIRIKTSCICTGAKSDKESYAPNETGIIYISFHPEDLQGPLKRTITVFTNDPKHRQVTCYLKADVQAEVRVLPRFLYVDNIQSNEVRNTTMTVSSETLKSLDITNLKSDEPFLKPVAVRKDNQHWEIQVRIDGAGVPKGKNRSIVYITFNTNSKVQEEILIQSFVTLKDPILVSPASVTLPGLFPGQPYHFELSLRTLDGTPLGIKNWKLNLKPEPASQCIEIVYSQKTGKRQKISLNIKKSCTLPDHFEGELILQTDYKKQPKVTIPIQGSLHVKNEEKLNAPQKKLANRKTVTE